MNNEFAADLITLIDDEGHEHEFEVLDVYEDELGCFYALVPNAQQSQDLNSATTYYIFESIEENGEQNLAEVEDENLLTKLSEIFESRFEDLYEVNDN